MPLLRWAAAALALLALAALLAWAAGAWRWRALGAQLLERLDAAAAAAPAAEAAGQAPRPALRYEAARELEGLPPAVQRFFRAALKDGQPLVAAVAIEHRGSFNLAAEGPERWQPFTSRQRSTVLRPGFVWDGRIRLLPGLNMHVHDAYLGGTGILRPALGGLLTLAAVQGSSPERGGIAEGEFMRFVAEAAWYPTALLPSQGARWRAGPDADSAEVTLADGAIAVTLRLRFDPASGLIGSVRAEARGRTVGQRVTLTPWEGRWSDYAEHHGMRVPRRGEVAWLLPEGPRAYWRGEVTALRYEFAR